MKNLPDLYLVDKDPELVAAWKDAFAGHARVEIVSGDFFSVDAQLMVSPANSFGFMDGGLDLAIRNRLGVEIEGMLQREIVEQFHGELPVGSCLIIETRNNNWPLLASAPTMRIPMPIAGTLNVYHAFRAMLLAATRHKTPIESILCPGMGTGIGGVAPIAAARQMEFAYSQFIVEPHIRNARETLSSHQELMKHV